MVDCIFCKIAKAEIPCSKVYEDDSTLAFLDVNPVNQGHTLVIPKEHAEKAHQLSERSSIALFDTIKKVSSAIESSLNVDFNIINNNGPRAGQIVKHVHFHIVPRSGSEKFKINWEKKQYADGEAEKVLERIKAKIVK